MQKLRPYSLLWLLLLTLVLISGHGGRGGGGRGGGRGRGKDDSHSIDKGFGGKFSFGGFNFGGRHDSADNKPQGSFGTNSFQISSSSGSSYQWGSATNNVNQQNQRPGSSGNSGAGGSGNSGPGGGGNSGPGGNSNSGPGGGGNSGPGGSGNSGPGSSGNSGPGGGGNSGPGGRGNSGPGSSGNSGPGGGGNSGPGSSGNSGPGSSGNSGSLQSSNSGNSGSSQSARTAKNSGPGEQVSYRISGNGGSGQNSVLGALSEKSSSSQNSRKSFQSGYSSSYSFGNQGMSNFYSSSFGSSGNQRGESKDGRSKSKDDSGGNHKKGGRRHGSKDRKGSRNIELFGGIQKDLNVLSWNTFGKNKKSKDGSHGSKDNKKDSRPKDIFGGIKNIVDNLRWKAFGGNKDSKDSKNKSHDKNGKGHGHRRGHRHRGKGHRIKKERWVYYEDKSQVQIPEVEIDWLAWSNWTLESDGWWVRRRTCKNGPNGLCRGQSIQKRKQVEGSEDDDEWSSDDSSGDSKSLDEFAEDWEGWGEWIEGADGWWSRSRKCKNNGKDAKCRGEAIQKRKRTFRKHKGGRHGSSADDSKDSKGKRHRGKKERWIYYEDKSQVQIPEVEIDWLAWSNWTLESDGWWVRRRTCKNGPNGLCRGQSIQKRKQVEGSKDDDEWSSDDSSSDDSKSLDEFAEDWEEWGEWTKGADGWWTRSRKCKNTGKDAKCRGEAIQKRKKTFRKHKGGRHGSSADDSKNSKGKRHRGKKERWIYYEDKSQVQIPEVEIDWLAWSNWTLESDGWWVRRRTCKNGPNGLCRGQSIQKRKQVEGSKDDDEWSSDDSSSDDSKSLDKFAKDWEEWGEWTKGADGWWTRSRKCKNTGKDAKCRGEAIQKRKKTFRKHKGGRHGSSADDSKDSKGKRHRGKKERWIYYEDKSQVQIPEVEIDWLAWSNWTLESDGWWVRRRTCKNGPNGLCRGQSIQKRKKVEGSEDDDEWSSDDSSSDDKVEEFEEDWFQWSDWIEDISGWWVRTRMCKNPQPGGKCRGKSAQKRRKRFWFYSIEQNSQNVTENAEDWEEWGEWIEGVDGWWTRSRKCKNTGRDAKCRGEAIQKRKRTFRKHKGGKHGSSAKDSKDSKDQDKSSEVGELVEAPGNLDSGGCDKFPEDWEIWEQWTLENDGFWTRCRKCKNSFESGKCRGSNKQKRRVTRKTHITTITTTTTSEIEVLSDWYEWGKWIWDVRGYWIRTRSCKHDGFNGLCRGKGTQTSETKPDDYDDDKDDMAPDDLTDMPIKDVDGGWSPWSSWSSLTGSSNPETVKRTRTCNNPAPSGLGKSCLGLDKDLQTVYTPIHGKWGEWCAWNPVFPETTIIYRTRKCDSPKPMYNGTNCQGPEIESKDYVRPTNGRWSNWGCWTYNGPESSNPRNLTRSRTCNNPSPSNGGALCEGSDKDYFLQYIPVAGGWSDWSSWFEMENDCKKLRRKRTCNNPEPKFNGKTCEGNNYETKDKELPVHGGWSQWSLWSEQTGARNPETVVRHRHCDNPTPANGGRCCEGENSDSKTIFYPIDGEWSDWCPWSNPTPDSNVVHRNRTCNNPKPVYNGKDCQGSNNETKLINKPVHGNWGCWKEWSTPTNASNPEMVTRKRYCDNPSPANNGNDCWGYDIETKEVYNPIDGIWEEWSEWVHNNVSRIKQRKRHCKNPLYGGKQCVGSCTETADLIFPVDGNWGSWSAWPALTGHCNPETIKRTRSCDNPSPANGGKYCEGNSEDTFTNYRPIDGGWSQWSDFVLSEDGNTEEHTRCCSNPSPAHGGKHCEGIEYESRPVDRPIDGNWDNWGYWSIPTEDGNPKISKRIRHCNNPEPSGGGKDCIGKNTEERNVYIPEDGNWSEWSEEVENLLDEIKKIKRRTCNNPKPRFNGRDCEGDKEKIEIIGRIVNGQWSQWSCWSEPSRTSNPDILTRHRYCDNPPPANEGLECVGENYETKELLYKIDGNWGPWTEWSLPKNNSTIVTRTRVCNNPPPQHCGEMCFGRNTDQKDIYLPVNGSWGPWSPFSEITGKQNPETITRYRYCDSPYPANNGSPCEGKDFDDKVIYRPIDGQWSIWGLWINNYTNSTGYNQFYRLRECNNPAPMYNGTNCNGTYIEWKDELTPINGAWSAWTEWQKQTFESDFEVRNRYCNNPTPQNNGTVCVGEDSDRKNLPIDGKWGPWSEWSHSDVNKTLERRRYCNNPAPNSEGANCVGPDYEVVDAVEDVDGGWSVWEDWVKVSTNTNPELYERRRYCNNPTPANRGANCQGNYTETNFVYSPINGGWTLWSEWSLPTGQQNPETLKRTRSCTSPAPAFGGASCNGSDEETREVTRPINGIWGDWGRWACPEQTKITDTWIRLRKCDNPAPLYGGEKCVGTDTEIRVVPKSIDGGWGEWKEWPKPTWRTNPDTLVRRRYCDNPAPLNNGKYCVGSNKEIKKEYKPINGNWAQWRAWEIPNGGILPVNITRTRTCTNPAPKFNGSYCQGKNIEVKLLTARTPIDGNWSPWSNWAEPTELSNPELVNRTRVCNNPQPLFNGKDCVGVGIEYKNITRPINGSWGEWSPWSPHEVPSDLSLPETFIRTRRCDSPEPLYGGRNCNGSESDFMFHYRPVNGDWTEWSEWSTPQHLTNPETLKRYRFCTNPEPMNDGIGCPGNNEDAREFSTPINGNWGPWSAWTTPLNETTFEVLNRTRLCDSPAPAFGGEECVGKSIESQNYTNPTHGGWSPWTEWEIDATNPTLTVRKRFCDSPAPQYGGRDCEGNHNETSLIIRDEPFPVNGFWTPWSDWSAPTGLINPESIKRTRSCSNPTPAFGGKPCEGESTEFETYYNPVDGHWSDWSEWSEPIYKNETGNMIITRTRLCDSPAPAYKGDDCSGPFQESTEFVENSPPAPIHGNWGEWLDWIIIPSPVNPTNKTRYRLCDSPPPLFNGTYCLGSNEETEIFYQPVNGQWGAWSNWSSYQEGNSLLTKRTRICDNPKPQHEGENCDGSSEETNLIQEQYNERINGGWSPWSEWSNPIGVVAQETLIRKRICDNPTPAFGGDPCPESDTEVKEHFNPINGKWGDWSDWSALTGLVNPEIVSRSRVCNSPSPQNGGLECFGDSTENQEIFTPVNGYWGPWSPILIEDNIQIRKRICDSPRSQYGGLECVGDDKEIIGPVQDNGSPDNLEEAPPEDGIWSEWSDWTSFSKTEIDETFKRQRVCEFTSSNHGKPCDGEPTESITYPLPIDGGFTSWSEWSIPTGNQNPETVRRTRSCTNPAPANGGKSCDGPLEDTKNITINVPEKINGGWSAWSNWELDKDEGNLKYIRKRTCTNPSPQNGGDKCEGHDSETKIKIVCPPDYQHIEQTNKCYKLIKKRLTWDQARDKCRSKHSTDAAHLAIIDDQVEQNVVANYFASINSTLKKKCLDPNGVNLDVWFAGKKTLNTQFNWLPENDLKPKEMKYSAWEPTYPTGKNSEVRCTYFKLPHFTWVDGPCGCSHSKSNESNSHDEDSENSSSSEDSSDSDDGDDVNWDLWTGWIKGDDGYWTRSRICKLEAKGGSCKGKKLQRRRKITKIIKTIGIENSKSKSKSLSEDSEDSEDESSWSYDSDDITEIKDGWEDWGEWELQADGWWLRKRTCKKEATGDKCIGKKVQRRRRKTWRVDGIWEISHDKSRDCGPGVLEDWEEWGEWVKDEKTGVWTRSRKCKRPDNKCRGRKSQKRRKIKIIEHDSRSRSDDKEDDGCDREEFSIDTDKNSKPVEDSPQDYEKWSEWSLQTDGTWNRTRTCKRADKLCKGVLIQKRRKLIWRIIGSYSIDESVDSRFEVVEDWNEWSNWVKNKRGWEVRTRICKNKGPNAKCRGSSKQTRRMRGWRKTRRHIRKQWIKMISGGAWSLDLSEGGEKSFDEDWLIWGEWSEGSDGWSVRTRVCKNSGPNAMCRGRKMQRRRRKIMKKESHESGSSDKKSGSRDDSWSLDQGGVENLESLERWDEWSIWTFDRNGYWIRTRTCKNNGNCKGNNKQRRRKRMWRVQGSWSIDETECIPGVTEVLEDWDQWESWTLVTNGIWVRTRKCRNPNESGKCRGVIKQRRRKKGWKLMKLKWNWKLSGNWQREEEDSKDENSKDWDLWGEWTQSENDGWIRKRFCKKKNQGSNCKGKNVQRLRKRIWKRVGSWSLDITEGEEKSAGDWKEWSEWTNEEDGCIVRTRQCKNNLCKGSRRERKRKRVLSKEEDSSSSSKKSKSNDKQHGGKRKKHWFASVFESTLGQFENSKSNDKYSGSRDKSNSKSDNSNFGGKFRGAGFSGHGSGAKKFESEFKNDDLSRIKSSKDKFNEKFRIGGKFGGKFERWGYSENIVSIETSKSTSRSTDFNRPSGSVDKLAKKLRVESSNGQSGNWNKLLEKLVGGVLNKHEGAASIWHSGSGEKSNEKSGGKQNSKDKNFVRQGSSVDLNIGGYKKTVSNNQSGKTGNGKGKLEDNDKVGRGEANNDKTNKGKKGGENNVRQESTRYEQTVSFNQSSSRGNRFSHFEVKEYVDESEASNDKTNKDNKGDKQGDSSDKNIISFSKKSNYEGYGKDGKADTGKVNTGIDKEKNSEADNKTGKNNARNEKKNDDKAAADKAAADKAAADKAAADKAAADKAAADKAAADKAAAEKAAAERAAALKAAADKAAADKAAADKEAADKAAAERDAANKARERGGNRNGKDNKNDNAGNNDKPTNAGNGGNRRRSKRSASKENKKGKEKKPKTPGPAYDPTCGINMCALCELDLD